MRLHAADHGIHTGDVSIDVEKMLSRKDKIVSELTDGIGALFKSSKIVFHAGRGCLVEAGVVRVSSEDQDDQRSRQDTIWWVAACSVARHGSGQQNDF